MLHLHTPAFASFGQIHTALSSTRLPSNQCNLSTLPCFPLGLQTLTSSQRCPAAQPSHNNAGASLGKQTPSAAVVSCFWQPVLCCKPLRVLQAVRGPPLGYLFPLSFFPPMDYLLLLSPVPSIFHLLPLFPSCFPSLCFMLFGLMDWH